MRGLGKITANLAQQRRRWDEMVSSAATMPGALGGIHAASVPSRLVEMSGFGSNPGNLRMFAYVPERLTPSPALVVVLHGCTQNAAGYDHGTGWSTLADRYGFALLFPEQQSANNPKTCFNWFQPGDIERDRGEPLSIHQMVERMVLDHGIDRRRVFVTGLSAGGAMTSVMLATYPETFAGGAIVAGLPYGAATNVQEAFESMFQGRTRPAREWGDLVRAASPHRGPWPKVSIWHGGADATVKPINAGEIAKQWIDVHGLQASPTSRDMVDGYPRQVWRGASGEELIEDYAIPNMAHGTPLATGEGDDRSGAAGPFLLEVGISSSYHIAKFWGLTGRKIQAAEKTRGSEATKVPEGSVAVVSPEGAVTLAPTRVQSPGQGSRPNREEPQRPQPTPTPANDVQSIITKALRAAGLMK